MTQWDDIEKRLQQLMQRRVRLQGHMDAAEQERQTQMKALMQANDRVQAGDFVRDILNRLQQKEHERAVGVYEQLLGAFLSDVLPGERKIVMDLHADRGAPGLDIFVRKDPHSPLEDSFGGAATNLLSTGLRLVALLRSGQRRFMVLDEADCWIKPDLIPRYAAIVSQMSRDLNVQVLMISHHNESLFAQSISHRLNVQKMSSGLISADWSASSDIPQWDVDQQGLRSIELKQFQSHQHTCIPLSPNVTLLQGDNDIGKSSVVNALRAVFEGDSNDTMIQHHCNDTKIAIDFGPDNILTWQRFKKGKVKVSYKLVHSDTHEIMQDSDGTKVPEWVRDHSQIGRIEGLDVQIGQQKEPVFLLNAPASTRAKALAIGQESGHVNSMMLLDRQEMSESKGTVKAAEKALERLRRQLDVLEQLSNCEVNVDHYHHLKSHSDINIQRKNIFQQWQNALIKTDLLAQLSPNLPNVPKMNQNLRPLLKQWTFMQDKQHVLEPITKNQQIHTPVLKSGSAAYLFNQWSRSTHVCDVLSSISNKRMLDIPVLSDKNAIKVYQDWSKNIEMCTILYDITNSKILNYSPNALLMQYSKTAAAWKSSQQQEKNLLKEEAQLISEMKTTQDAISTAHRVCPTCHQKLPAQHDHT